MIPVTVYNKAKRNSWSVFQRTHDTVVSRESVLLFKGEWLWVYLFNRGQKCQQSWVVEVWCSWSPKNGSGTRRVVPLQRVLKNAKAVVSKGNGRDRKIHIQIDRIDRWTVELIRSSGVNCWTFLMKIDKTNELWLSRMSLLWFWARSSHSVILPFGHLTDFCLPLL